MAVVALAFVVISLVALAVAVADTVRFARRTGYQAPADLTYRAYLA
jgi:hypothetical protein